MTMMRLATDREYFARPDHFPCSSRLGFAASIHDRRAAARAADEVDRDLVVAAERSWRRRRRSAARVPGDHPGAGTPAGANLVGTRATARRMRTSDFRGGACGLVADGEGRGRSRGAGERSRLRAPGGRRPAGPSRSSTRAPPAPHLERSCPPTPPDLVAHERRRPRSPSQAAPGSPRSRRSGPRCARTGRAPVSRVGVKAVKSCLPTTSPAAALSSSRSSGWRPPAARRSSNGFRTRAARTR